MNDGIKMYGTIEYVLFDKDGNVKDSGKYTNQIQTLLKERVIDAMDTGSFTDAVTAMAIGTGTGAGVGDAALVSKVSDEDISSQTQPTSTQLQNVATFTNVSATITEAGLFDNTLCTDDMYTYDDSLNVVMTSSDSLQITWTISVS